MRTLFLGVGLGGLALFGGAFLGLALFGGSLGSGLLGRKSIRLLELRVPARGRDRGDHGLVRIVEEGDPVDRGDVGKA